MKFLEIVLIFVISVVVCDESDENDQESMSLDSNSVRLPGYPPSYVPSYPEIKPGYPVSPPIVPVYPPSYPEIKPGYPVSPPIVPVYPPSYPENKPGYPVSPPIVPVYPPSYPEIKPGYPVSPPIVPVYPPSYPENKPGYPVSPPIVPVYPPSYPVSEPGYTVHPPSYPESEPVNLYTNYWRLFFEGPQTFSVTPAGATYLTFYMDNYCNAENLTGLTTSLTAAPGSMTCNGLTESIGALNFTTNGGTGYLYINNLWVTRANLNGNTIEAIFGQVTTSNPTTCTGTYLLQITIWRANDQLECTNGGLTGQVALYSITYTLGSCQASCYLKTGTKTFSPTISVTGAGPAIHLP